MLMKKLLLIMVLMPMMAWAYETWKDPSTGIEWKYVISEGAAHLYGAREYVVDNFNKPGHDEYTTAIPPATTGEVKIPSVFNGYSVTSIGSFAFYSCSGLTSVTIPSSVTCVGDYAFAYCSGLTSVTIPPSVTSIGEYAFRGCSGLMSLLMSEGVKSIGGSAFSVCSELTSVTIPSSVTSIGDYAFAWDTGLAMVTVPASVKSIGLGTFAGCSGLTSMTLPFVGSQRGSSGKDALFGYIFGEYEGAGTVETKQYYSSSSYTTFFIPSALKAVVITDETKIGYGAFGGCKGLTSVTIPSSVTSIEEAAFYNCSGLMTIAVEGEDGTFFSKDGIVYSKTSELVVCPAGKSGEMTIPDGVTGIWGGAFLSCSELTSILVPMSVKNIGAGAFAGCSGLTSITLPFVGSKRGNSGTEESLFGHVFGKKSYYGTTGITQDYVDPHSGSSYSPKRATFYIPTLLETVVITDETKIGYGAFESCGSLTSITIPSSVDSIGNSAFLCCRGLTAVAIPSGVTSIGDSAFSECSGLTTVTISEGLMSIGTSAFSRCVGLTTITIPRSVTSIGESAFTGCSGLSSITLPFVGSERGAYRASSKFGYIFGAYEFNGEYVGVPGLLRRL